MELGTERQIGMAVGPIPLSAVRSYLKEHGLPEWWEPVIRQVDNHILAGLDKEAEAS